MANTSALCRFIALSASCSAMPALAIQPVVVKHARIEVDWAAPSIRFFGEAKSADLKGIEGAAWTEGVNYLKSKGDLQTALQLPSDFKLEPAKANIRSFNTVYFTDGKVRIHLESPLFSMIEGATISTSDDTKILVRLDKYIDPRLDFKIVASSGEELVTGLTTSTQPPKVTIARWFRGQGIPAGTDSNTPAISGSVSSAGTISVAAEEWREKKFDSVDNPQIYFLMP